MCKIDLQINVFNYNFVIVAELGQFPLIKLYKFNCKCKYKLKQIGQLICITIENKKIF